MHSSFALPLFSALLCSFAFAGAACSSNDDGVDALTAPTAGSAGATAAAGTSGKGGTTGKGGGGGKGGSSGKGGSGDTSCVPNQQVGCACLGGDGVQRCREDGSGFDECQCQEGEGGGTGEGGKGSSGNGGGTGDPNVDKDGDGWSIKNGDCNDDDPLVSPASFEVAGDKIDNDCDGTVDNAGVACDDDLEAPGSSPAGAARAIGLCQIKLGAEQPTGNGGLRWGVINATFSSVGGPLLTTPPATGADPTLQIGFLPSFGDGTKPKEGARVLAISSGIARATNQPGFDAAKSCGGSPTGTSNYATFSTGAPSDAPGFPKTSACGSGSNPHDPMAIDLAIRVPKNARSFSFKHRFFSCEYPAYACTDFNDVFAFFVSPSPLLAGHKMNDATNAIGDVAFRTEPGPTPSYSVIDANNIPFMTACVAGTGAETVKYTACKGETDLVNSGFVGHVGSAWLQTSSPVPMFEAGKDPVMMVRIAIWDSGDAILDSTAIIDDFQWSTAEVTAAVTTILPTP
jgi:hypothetical protein